MEKTATLAVAIEAELPEGARDFSAGTVKFAQNLLEDVALWQSVCAWNALTFIAERRGMEPLVSAVREGRVPADAARVAFDVNYCRTWLSATRPKE